MIKELKKEMIDKITDLNIKAYYTTSKIARRYKRSEMKDFINMTFKQGKIFGYFKEGELIGVIGIAIDKKFKSGEMRHLFVNQEYRNKGIGKELLNFIEKYARKIKLKRIKLDVLADNNTAINFYNKRKYKIYAYKMERWL